MPGGMLDAREEHVMAATGVGRGLLSDPRRMVEQITSISSNVAWKPQATSAVGLGNES